VLAVPRSMARSVEIIRRKAPNITFPLGHESHFGHPSHPVYSLQNHQSAAKVYAFMPP
jgi:hypothetical protein